MNIHCYLLRSGFPYRFELAIKSTFDLEPENVGNYVLSAKLYSVVGIWRDAEKIRDIMKTKEEQLERKKKEVKAMKKEVTLNDNVDKTVEAIEETIVIVSSSVQPQLKHKASATKAKDKALVLLPPEENSILGIHFFH
ncbi:hypothetical protein VNO78_11306 [Psophocarpus tetragonolobus]|uniref:Uncharacterized protein n=1 Tax=Psophocarpus tetragonolobus TaxID=3891 RepID=A0AAN9XNB4_PSOTE